MSVKTVLTAFRSSRLALPVVFFGLYVTAVVFRPVMPIDETRYLTVAWEMLVRHDWLAPLTVNFQPYHHKPPLLFWLINLSWSLFGVSRWAATIPVALAAITCVLLTDALSKRLLPELRSRAQPVMIGSTIFLIYCTAILFDLTLTVFVLSTLLCFLAYAKERRAPYVLLAGLFLGLGVLTKGPVAYLHVAFPVVLAPYWMRENGQWKSWYLGSLAALLVSFIPVLLWLVPVLRASSDDFNYWLIWGQTVGRITGSFGGSHARPFYFYLMTLPLMLFPWVVFPRFWRGFAAVETAFKNRQGIRFLVIWIVPTFLAFSLIAGKQLHYMVPLLPGMAILIAYMTAGMRTRTLQATAAAMISLFIAMHVVLSGPVTSRFDLSPVADIVQDHSGQDLAFAGGNYQGEITFLARLVAPLDTPPMGELNAWFDAHPGGLATVRYRNPVEVADFDMLVTHPYHGGQLGVFTRESGRPSKLALRDWPRR